MQYTYQFNVANISLQFCSEYPLGVPKALALFQTAVEDHADYIYEFHMHDELPQIAPAPNVRYYYDQTKQSHYAFTHELGNQMHVHLTRKNLPWGSQIEQMYTQLALPHALLQKQKLLLHASYILTPQGAILFTAPSGTGKSTQAELWKKYRDAVIVNGDRGVIGLEDGIATAYGYPISGSSDDCRNISAKLLAIVSLKQATKNSVRELLGAQQLSVIINGSYLPQEYSSDLPNVVDTALTILKNVPMLELSCLPDKEAVEILEKCLLKTAKKL